MTSAIIRQTLRKSFVISEAICNRPQFLINSPQYLKTCPLKRVQNRPCTRNLASQGNVVVENLFKQNLDDTERHSQNEGDNKTKKEKNNKSPWVKSKLYNLVQNASSPEELYQLIPSHLNLLEKHPTASLGILSRLIKLSCTGGESLPNIAADNSLDQLLLIINAHVTTVPDELISATLLTMLTLHQSHPSLIDRTVFKDVLESLENECCWRFRSLDIKAVVTVLQAYLPSKDQRDSQVNLQDAGMKMIELHWMEIEDASTLIDIMYVLRNPPESTLRHLDTRALELILMDSLKQKELITILTLLSQSRRSNLPLLKSLTFHLEKSAPSLSLEASMKVMYSLANLSFTSFLLMERISKDVIESKLAESPESINLFFVSSLLNSIGKLRWRHPELLEALSESLLAVCHEAHQSNTDNFALQEKMHAVVLSLLRTCGTLNYYPGILQQLKPHFECAIDHAFKDDRLTLPDKIDLVWHLSLLGLALPKHLESLLTISNIWEELSSKSPSNMKLIQKLLQINTHARLDHLDLPYTGPFLNLSDPRYQEARKGKLEKTPTKKGRKDRFRDNVTAALPAAQAKSHKFEYVIFGPMMHSCGHVIDFLLLVDANGNILPIPEKLVSRLSETSPDFESIGPHLPTDTHCVAMLLFDVFDNTIYSLRAMADKAMAVRHLRALGYKICGVDLKSFGFLSNMRKTDNLNKLITAAVEPVI